MRHVCKKISRLDVWCKDMSGSDVYTLYATSLLQIGRSVLLSGAPGTGKTLRSIEITELFTGSQPVIVTGYSELTFEKLIDPEGDGSLLRSVLLSWLRIAHGLPPRWLLFDELNRANVEISLGPLFTLLDTRYRLSEDLLPPRLASRLTDPRFVERLLEDDKIDVSTSDAIRILKSLSAKGIASKLPLSWRMLATMNVFDQSHLYRVGFALLRRMPLIRIAWTYSPRPPSSMNAGVCRDARPLGEVILRACRIAVDELSMVNTVEIDGRTIVDLVSPQVSLALRYGLGEGDASSLAQKLLTRHEPLWKCLSRIIEELVEAGVEPGPSVLTDACKLLIVLDVEGGAPQLPRGSSIDVDSVVLDIIVSSMLLPLVAASAKMLRMDAMLGGTRVERIRELLDTIEDVLGDKSLSYIIARDVRLELGLETS